MIYDSILPNLTLPDKSYVMKKNDLFSEKYQFHYMHGTANFDEKFYVMEAKKGLSGKAPKMFPWT